MRCEKKRGSFLVWLFHICGLQFDIVKFVRRRRRCRLLLNYVNLGVLCIFSFGLISFVPINCLEIFFKPKIFSQSIMVSLSFRYFTTNWY